MMAKVLKCVGWGCQGPASKWRCSYSIAAELQDGGAGWGLLNTQVSFPKAWESYSYIDATLIALRYISVCEALV